MQTETFCEWRKQSVLHCDGVCIQEHFQPISESLSIKLSLDAEIFLSLTGSPVLLSHSFRPPDHSSLSVTRQLESILLRSLPIIAS